MASTQEPEDEETRAARAAAEKTFLKLEDFPAGWTQAPASLAAPQDLDLPSECQSPVLSRKQPPDSIVQADSPEFGSAGGQQVSSRVIVFRDEGAAQEYVDAVNEFIEEALDTVGSRSWTPLERARESSREAQRTPLPQVCAQRT